MSLGPDLTKTAMISMSVTPPCDRSASDSPSSSVSDRAARDSIISTQRLLPLHSTTTTTSPDTAATDHQRTDDRSTRRARRTHRCAPARDHAALPSNSLPDNDALVWSTVTSAGGRVTLPGSGQLSNDLIISNVIIKVKRLNGSIALRGKPITELRSVTCHM